MNQQVPQQHLAQVQQPGGFVAVTPPVASYQMPAGQPANQPPPNRYKEHAGRNTGWIQVFCGLASMSFGVVSVLVLFGIIHDPALRWGQHFVFAIVAWPIWGGLIFFIAGILGVRAKADNSCMITGYMVMSIIAALLASGQLIWECLAAVFTKCHEYNYDPYNHYDNYYNKCNKPFVSYGMHLGAVLAAAVELIAAITGSVFCCHGVCCGQNNTPTVIHQVQYHQYPAQNAVITQAAPYQQAPQQAPAGIMYPSMPAPVGEYAPPGYSATPEYPVASAPDQTFMHSELPVK